MEPAQEHQRGGQALTCPTQSKPNMRIKTLNCALIIDGKQNVTYNLKKH